ncbi:hypothetical protein BU14_0288s0020 [Porphyra umbilicalis]|uniref:Uncharacterized protein n=1 Tax=Porphyra umbilicalis TaxID=2786 RepID=A0A1X6P115_PORUM|nr:hypothetical protein BU14_0288s0020 [Porphyra umbilicalis]|eukprot:OSX74466.1 hypothetical protein BU14_0288s0020 [Porphyra umbilicalis]
MPSPAPIPLSLPLDAPGALLAPTPPPADFTDGEEQPAAPLTAARQRRRVGFPLLPAAFATGAEADDGPPAARRAAAATVRVRGRRGGRGARGGGARGGGSGGSTRNRLGGGDGVRPQRRHQEPDARLSPIRLRARAADTPPRHPPVRHVPHTGPPADGAL